MWQLLYQLGRPSLHRVLVDCARQRHGRPASNLDPADPLDQADRLRLAASTSEACWRALRFTIAKRRWRPVRDSLRRQRHRFAHDAARRVEPDWLLALSASARSARQRRAVARLDAALAARQPSREAAPAKLAGMLDKRAMRADRLLADPRDEAAVLRGIARVYTKARRRMMRAPRSARARHWLHLQWQLLDLLGVRPADDPIGPLERLAAGARRLVALVAEDGWLRTIVRGSADAHHVSRRDRERLARLARARRRALRRAIDSEVRLAFALPPAALLAALPWECFRLEPAFAPPGA
jgi:hypothetical protein